MARPNATADFKAFAASALFFVVLGLVFVAFSPTYRWSEERESAPFGADFLQEWIGGHMIEKGQARQLYSSRFVELQHSPAIVGFRWDETEYYPSVYPPPHYLLFSPFALLPYSAAVYVFLGLLLTTAWAATLTIAKLSSPQASLPSSPQASSTTGLLAPRAHGTTASSLEPPSMGQKQEKERGAALPWILLGLVLFPSTLFSISLGQKSLMWLMLWSAMAYCMRMHQSTRAGLLLGLLSIKPTLVFLMPLVMLKERNWRFLSGAIAGGIALWGMTALLLPIEVWIGFWNRLRSVTDYSANSGFRLEWSCTLISLANVVPAGWQSWFKLAVCLPIAGGVLIGVMTDRRSWMFPGRWFSILCATALLAPHFYHYDLVLLLLPILWNMAIDPRRSLFLFGILAAALAICQPGISESAASQSVGLAAGLPVVPLVLLFLFGHSYWKWKDPLP